MASSSTTQQLQDIADPQMDQDFYVDGIVAERIFPDGTTRYLVKWEDYPHWDNTWEPEEHLQNETLADWYEELARIKLGQSRAFDVDVWEAAVEDRLKKAEAKERKARLNALVEKRAQNLGSDDLDDFVVLSDNSESSGDEFVPHYRPRKRQLSSSDEEPPMASPKQRRRALENTNQNSSVEKGKQQADRPSASTPPGAATATDMSVAAPISDSMVPSKQLEPVLAPKPTVHVATPNPKAGAEPKVSDAPTVADIARQLKPARKAMKGAGPMRQSKAMPSNIFNNWNATVRKRKQNTGPKSFKNPSHAWNVEKLGRNEPAPDISSLQLIAPHDGSYVTPKRAEKQIHLKPPENSLDEVDSLFLSQSPPDLSEGFMGGTRNDETNTSHSLSKGKAKDVDITQSTRVAPAHLGAAENLEHTSTATVETKGVPPGQGEASISNMGQPRYPTGFSDWGPNTRRFEDMAKNIGVDSRQLYGTLIIGANNPTARQTIFRGIPPPWWGIFLRIKPHYKDKDVFVRITQLCTASGYIRDYHYDGQGYFAAGYIPHWPKQNSYDPFTRFLTALRDKTTQYGGLFFSEHYTLLVYAPGSPSWGFIDKLYPSESPPSALRFVMRAPVPANEPEIPTKDAFPTEELLLSSEKPLVQKPDPQKNATATSQTQTLHSVMMMMAGNPDFDRIFKDALGFEWKDILPPNSPKDEPPIFFLHYDISRDAATAELLFMRAILQDSLGMRVYGSDRSGEWSLFCQPRNVKCGVILFHTSVPHYEGINDLAKVLRNGSYHCWRIELKLAPDRSILQRIFPSGGVVLIPDSLVLRKPDMVSRIIRWYRKTKTHTMNRSQWKLAMRPRFRKWIHAIIDNTGSYQRSTADRGPYRDLLAQLMSTFPLSTTYDSNTDMDRPVANAALVDPGELDLYDESIGTKAQEPLKHNDDLLVQWFGRWSLRQVEKHRKFYVIFDGHGNDVESDSKIGSTWARSWRHVNVMKSKVFAKENMVQDEALYNPGNTGRRDSKEGNAEQMEMGQ